MWRPPAQLVTNVIFVTRALQIHLECVLWCAVVFFAQIRHASDAFMALTTDGVHGVLNNSEIVQIVSSCVDAHEAAHLVVDQALLYGATDNCTALIVPFGAWGKFASAAAKPLIFSRCHQYFGNR